MNSSLRNIAYTSIKQKILITEYVPGNKISEQIIMSDLKLGRTPVREAIIQLKLDGFLQVIPQSGTYISKINLSKARNARFVRENIEKEVIKEVADNHTSNDIEKIKKIIEQQKFYSTMKDIPNFFIADDDFHKLLYSISNKKEIWSWLKLINVDLDRFRWLRLQVTNLKWNRIVEQHLAIYDAIINNDALLAESLIQNHLHLMLEEQQQLIAAFPDYFINASN